MIAFAAVFSFAACNDSETYKDMRDRELDSISSFLRKENIKVISEDEFTRRWNNNQRLTDTAKSLPSDLKRVRLLPSIQQRTTTNGYFSTVTVSICR